MRKRYRETICCDDLTRTPFGTCTYGPYRNIPDIQGHSRTLSDTDDHEISGWFIGTKAENADIFSRFIQEAINAMTIHRRSFHPEDPSHITEEIKRAPGYLSAIQSLTDNFRRLLATLNEYSTPFFSMRYQGHMLWDTTMAAKLGYFAAMLHNSNNCSVQASVATTFLEMLVGNDICKMIAFDPSMPSWAHITCDGTVANLESMWAAREVKFLPISIRNALQKEFHAARDLDVLRPDGSREELLRLDTWQLLNITSDAVLQLPQKIAAKCGLQRHEVWETLSRYSINTLGVIEFYRQNLTEVGSPVILVPSTKHYSLPKSAAVLGMGAGGRGLIDVYVDADARLDIDNLQKTLNTCISQQRPVLLTIAVMGSTEESAVDPLEQILEIREAYRRRHNFDFNIHADAAWGGYLLSVIRNDYDIRWPGTEKAVCEKSEEPFLSDVSTVPLNDYTIRQFKNIRYCDSVTIDPHKCGYIPYPAGSLAYRNKEMINLVTFGAPYIGEPGKEPSMGEFGIEGSKPGASAAAVFLSHSVIRPSVKGYGKLLNRSLINAKWFYIYLLFIARPDDPFFVVPLPRLASEKNDGDILEDLKFIECNICGKNIDDIMADKDVSAYFKELGPDQNILNYAFNFYNEDGSVNTNIQKLNAFNQMIYDQLHIQPGTRPSHYDLLVTMTTFYRKDYGDDFMTNLSTRLGLSEPQTVAGINCLRSVVMDPWVAETWIDGSGLNFFQAVIVPRLRNVVIDCVDLIGH